MAELPPPATLGWLDGAVIAAYLLLSLGVGVMVARRGGGTLDNFFLSGRSLPWWLAGTSMVATSFASDTPLVVSGWTRAGGVAGNWRWWGYLVGTMLAVVAFARLWRRSPVLTDVEFMELRYSGAPARALRAFKGVYQVVFLHCFVLGWVLLGMSKVLAVLLDLSDAPVLVIGPIAFSTPWLATLACVLVAAAYAEVSGLWGVVLTDFFQFGLALTGAVVLAVLVTDSFGGVGGLAAALAASPATAAKVSIDAPAALLSPSPWDRQAWEFVILAGVLWIANKNSDGGGIMVQRLLACRNERHAVVGSAWYAIAFYAVRPWPWILVALASLLVLPPLTATSPADGTVATVGPAAIVVRDAAGVERAVEVPDAGLSDWTARPRVAPGDAVEAGQVLAAPDDESAYPVMMRRFLPAGLLGLMVAAFLAAFMSTVDSHLNLASAYLVNDVYRRFLRPDADEAHLMRAARATGLAVLALSLVFATMSDSLRGMFDVFTTLFGGVGFVYVLRWFWWRINAWSEIAALATSAAATAALQAWPRLGAAALPAALVEGGEPVFVGRLLLVLGLSVVVVLPVTWLTPPVDASHLRRFFDLVAPMGAWGPVARRTDGPLPALGRALRLTCAWAASVVMVLGCMFLPASWLLQDGRGAAVWAACALGGAALTWWTLPSLPSRHAPRSP